MAKLNSFFLACEKPQDEIKKKKEVTPKQVVQTHFSFPGFQTKKQFKCLMKMLLNGRFVSSLLMPPVAFYTDT